MNTCKQQSINSFMMEVLSYRNQSTDLFCKSIDWFLYNRDLCHERFKTLFTTYAESLFLHVVKHNFFFLFQFFFLSVFFNEYSRFTRQQLKGQTLSLLISFQPLPPASQAFTHQLGYCYRKLTSAHSWQLESNMKSLVQALQNLLFLRLYWQLLFYFVFSFYLSFISRTFRGRRRAFL